MKESKAEDEARATPRRVLLVDDDRTQLKLSLAHLQAAGFEVTTASGAAEALELAHRTVPDAIVSDVLMGEIDGFGLCRRMREDPSLAQVPIILLSAHYDDTSAHELAASVGAAALVERTPEFERELQALQQALDRCPTTGMSPAAPDTYERHLRANANQITRLLGAARSASERYRALFENANDQILVLDPSGSILEANDRWRHVLGVSPAALLRRSFYDFAPDRRVEVEAAFARGSGYLHAIPLQRVDGETLFVDFSINFIEFDDGLVGFAIGRDVTGRVLAAQALATAEEKYRSLVERLPDVVCSMSESSFIFLTANVEQMTGYTPAELYERSERFWGEQVHPDDEPRYAETRKGETRTFANPNVDVEYRWRRRDGAWIWLRHRVTSVYERAGVRYCDALISEITQRKELEASLRQAQKVEALGQLTGGIAHDFNNLLATVLANSQFLIEAMDQNDPRLEDAKDIMLAAERGAALTRQLLAFSRRQLLEPRIIDLNRVIGGLDRLLRRLLGEDIVLKTSLEPDLRAVYVDAGQIEQVVINLAVNARDAMPAGGNLTIETLNAPSTPNTGSPPDPTRAGGNVVIRVSDTGVGMDLETQRRIFEPFFTTKPVGRGTGLGLATCHAIVSQSGGRINVFSEPGRGAAFEVCLPSALGSELVAESPEIQEVSGHGETILLVEDDLPLRAAVERMLTARGYRVVSSPDGREVASVALAAQPAPSLLLTDIVMPRTSGPEVAAAVVAALPGVRVLYMSGYSDHAIFSAHALDENVNFIQKPFTPLVLTRKVREILDS